MTVPTYTSFSTPIMYGDVLHFSEVPEPATVTPSSQSLVGKDISSQAYAGDYLPGSLNPNTNTFTVLIGPAKLVKLDSTNNWGIDNGH